VAQVHDDLTLCDVKQGSELLPSGVRRLVAQPDVNAPVFGDLHARRVGLQVGVVLRGRPEAVLEDQVGLGKPRLYFPLI